MAELDLSSDQVHETDYPGFRNKQNYHIRARARTS